MKNFAEQQMGAVLNPYANHPEMNRAVVTSSAEMPEAVQAAIERFDSACKSWGWQEDQGHVGTDIEASESEYGAARVALIGVILAELQSDQWQPIETAPKDGTDILCVCMRTKDDCEEHLGHMEVDSWKERYRGFGKFNNHSWPATHWMPIPSLPKVSE